MQIPFYERWKLLEKEVIEPRNMEREALSKSISPYYRYDLEPFGVRIMIFLSSETVSSRLSYLFKF
jgi:mRNA-capping enzyme